MNAFLTSGFWINCFNTAKSAEPVLLPLGKAKILATLSLMICFALSNAGSLLEAAVGTSKLNSFSAA